MQQTKINTDFGVKDSNYGDFFMSRTQSVVANKEQLCMPSAQEPVIKQQNIQSWGIS